MNPYYSGFFFLITRSTSPVEDFQLNLNFSIIIISYTKIFLTKYFCIPKKDWSWNKKTSSIFFFHYTFSMYIPSDSIHFFSQIILSTLDIVFIHTPISGICNSFQSKNKNLIYSQWLNYWNNLTLDYIIDYLFRGGLQLPFLARYVFHQPSATVRCDTRYIFLRSADSLN